MEELIQSIFLCELPIIFIGIGSSVGQCSLEDAK